MLLNMSKEKLLVLIQCNYDLTIVALFAVVITYCLSKALRRPSTGDRQDIPGRLGFPFIGETFAFLSATNSTKGCYNFVELRRSWYGKIFKTRIFGKVHIFVPSREGAKRIFTNDFADFNKGYVKSMADCVGSKSLLCIPHESHKRIRRLLQDPFSMPALAKHVQKYDRMLNERLIKLEENKQSFRALEFNMKMTFDAMCNMLLSVTEASALQELERDCTAVSDAMLSFPVMIPGTRYYKGIKARERVMETFKKIIYKRRRGIESHDDFLQTMLERDPLQASEKLDDSELMDNLLTLIIAGQTTTAAAIMWCIKFLDENKHVQEKLREEQCSIAKNKGGEALTLKDLNSMSYGLKVVKETLRMSNVLLWYPRVVLNDCTIEGFNIKKGMHVNIDTTCIHYDPDNYKDPLKFIPERFDEMLKPYSFIPFGSGPRTCLGMNMAKVTMLVFLHRLTAGYTWTVDDPDLSLEKKAHIPRLRSGCPITLKNLTNRN